MHLCNYSMNNQRVRVGLVGCGREGGGSSDSGWLFLICVFFICLFLFCFYKQFRGVKKKNKKSKTNKNRTDISAQHFLPLQHTNMFTPPLSQCHS